MYIISKEFAFEAAHHLVGLPPEHQCARPHGHSYRVVVVLAASRLNTHGFVLDYGDLAPLADFLKARFDHRDLNEVLPLVFPDAASHQTSAENLARLLYEWCAARWGGIVYSVIMHETAKTAAEYIAPDAPALPDATDALAFNALPAADDPDAPRGALPLSSLTGTTGGGVPFGPYTATGEQV